VRRILCKRGKAEEALTRMRELMSKLKLTVNQEKTRFELSRLRGIGRAGSG
jgi:hypothetical protein